MPEEKKSFEERGREYLAKGLAKWKTKEKRKDTSGGLIGLVKGFIGDLSEKTTITDRYSVYIKKHGLDEGEKSTVGGMALRIADVKQFEIELLQMLIHYGEPHLQGRLDELQPKAVDEATIQRNKCNAVLAKYMIKLQSVSLNMVKPYLKDESLKDHHKDFLEQSKDVQQFLKKLIEDGIEPTKLESLIQAMPLEHEEQSGAEQAGQKYKDRREKHDAIKDELDKEIDELEKEVLKLYRTIQKLETLLPDDEIEDDIQRKKSKLQRMKDDLISLKQKRKSMSG